MTHRNFRTARLMCFLAMAITLLPDISFAQMTVFQFVQSIVSQARQSLVNKDIKTANLVFVRHFDMVRFGERCLVDHWDEFNSEERENYITLLQQNIEKRMQERLLLTNEDTNFSIKTIGVIDEGNGLLRVNNLLYVRGEKIPLSLFLNKNGAQFGIVDYEVDGVLLSRQYRASFNRFLRSNSKEAFLKRLEEKLGKRVVS